MDTTEDSIQSVKEKTAEPASKWLTWRNITAFWILGLCNNYVYVIMLSAAHDVISQVENKGENNETVHRNDTLGRHCNELSTGAILLADILPTLAVKTIFPFLPFLVHFRLGFAILTGILALVLVAMAKNIAVALTGVCFASFNSGLGELTLLAYSTNFPLYAVAAWSSGTGGAGLAGSFAYAGMTEGGLSPAKSLYVSIIFPLFMAVAFWFILRHPPKDILSASETVTEVISDGQENKSIKDCNSISQKLINDITYIPKLLKYMIPVGLVYYFEYLINSGLFEVLIFENTSISRSAQFRWYNAMYQIGVFISRSSVNFFHIEKVWIMAVLQGVNVIIFTLEAIYGFIPNVWIMFVLIFWEGLLGGAAYVNTFYTMSYKVPEDRRLFALSIASVADTFGIVFAGLSSLPLHDALCKVKLDPVFRWP